MTRKANAPVFVLIILLIISLSLAGGGFYLFQKERLKAMDLATKVQELTEKERMTEAKLEESKKVVDDLQIKLQGARDQADKAAVELQQEKALKQQALSKLDQLSAELKQANDIKADLEKKAAQADNDSKRTQNKLNDLQLQKDQLEAKLKQMAPKPAGVELGNIVVSPDTAATAPETGEVRPAPGSLEGKVLVMNRDYNFVVINLGSKDGVGIGDMFSVYHENKYIGDVKVEKVHESMAAAGYVSEGLKNKISEGDKVVQKAK